MIIEYVKNPELLRPLGELWMQEHNGDALKWSIDVNDVIDDANATLQHGNGAVIAAKEGDEYVGFLFLFVAANFLGEGNVAIEKYWYAKPNSYMAAPRMLKAAKKWAKERGCGKLIMSASKLASDKHDAVCEFYERMGLQKFETTYICEVA